jgi:hypothetical protein
MGDDFVLEKIKCPTFKLKAYLPKVAKIKLIKNGKCIDEYIGMESIWEINEIGNYRVECWLGEKAWIFSNYIRILS